MVARYISELLLNHDCVIIPGFGGLMAQWVGASFNEELKTLIPPSRKVLFNNQLVINDGLLVNYISRKEKISYADASLQLIKWTEEIKGSVNAGNRFVLEGIGSFYLNHEKKLQFTPDKQSNFLLAAYGLKPVSVTSISGRKPKSVNENRKAVSISSYKAAEHISIAAAIALLIASALMFPKFEMNLASLAGFWNKESNITNENINSKPAENVAEVKQDVVSIPAEVSHNIESEPEATEEPIKEEAIASSVPVTEPEHITPEPVETKGSYHVIAGCFMIEENAGKLVEQLTAQGLQASIIGKSKTGLTMVSAGRFTTAAEASKKLNEFKSLLPDGGWVYHQSAEE